MTRPMAARACIATLLALMQLVWVAADATPPPADVKRCAGIGQACDAVVNLCCSGVCEQSKCCEPTGGSCLENSHCCTGVCSPQNQCLDPCASQVLLRASQVHCDVHESLTITATVLSANNAPVSNAAVTFAAHGECDPQLGQVTTYTDAFGHAAIRINAHKRGALAVVAAVLPTSLCPSVASAPVHAIFSDDYEYTQRREREYYGSRGGRTEAHDQASGGDLHFSAAPGSEAEAYAAIATGLVSKTVKLAEHGGSGEL